MQLQQETNPQQLRLRFFSFKKSSYFLGNLNQRFFFNRRIAFFGGVCGGFEGLTFLCFCDFFFVLFWSALHGQAVRSAVPASGRLHSSAHKPCSKPASCTIYQGQTKPNPHQTRSLRNGSAAAPARAKFFGKTDNMLVVSDNFP